MTERPVQGVNADGYMSVCNCETWWTSLSAGITYACEKCALDGHQTLHIPMRNITFVDLMNRLVRQEARRHHD